MNLILRKDILKSPLFKDLNSGKAQDYLLECLVVSIEFAGMKRNEDSNALKFIVQNVYKEIVRNFPGLRTEEIGIAFKKGALKEYGDYFGINVASVYGWVKKYWESSEVVELRKEHLKLEEPKELTKEQKLEITKGFCKEAFDEYKQTGHLNIYAHSFLNYLKDKFGEEIDINGKKIKTFITSKEDRLKVRNEAQKECEAKAKKDLEHYRLSNREKYKDLVSYYLDEKNTTFENIQKKHAVKWLFDKLIKEGKEIC